MRIGVLTGTFHPDPGGPSIYLFHLLPELTARGHHVGLVTFGQEDAPARDYTYPVTRASGGRVKRIAGFLRAAWGLAGRSDVLFAHTLAILMLPMIRLRFRRRIVVKVVGDWVWEMADRRKLTALGVEEFQKAALPLGLRILKAYHRLAVRTADTVIVPSRHVARLVEGWGVEPARIRVIYNAIPDPKLSGTPRAALRHELGLPAGKLIVSVARLTPVKGVDVMLRALERLPEWRLIVIGDGPQKPALEQMPAAARTVFSGRLAHDDVLRYVRAADIYVLSSRTEGLSHTLLEALAVGTPSAATRVGGNPEVITDGVDGLLVPPDDPGALAEAILRLADPGLYAQISAAALKRSEAFRWDSEVAQTIETLEQSDAR